MLPFGFLMAYLRAYVYQVDDENLDMPSGKKNQLSTDRDPADDYLFDVPRDPFLSPLSASDEMLKKFPPIKIVVSLSVLVLLDLSFVVFFYVFQML